MKQRSRTILLAVVAALGLIAFASPHHRADIRILTHRADDSAPHSARAVVDLGLASISVLVTWSKRLGY